MVSKGYSWTVHFWFCAVRRLCSKGESAPHTVKVCVLIRSCGLLKTGVRNGKGKEFVWLLPQGPCRNLNQDPTECQHHPCLT